MILLADNEKWRAKICQEVEKMPEIDIHNVSSTELNSLATLWPFPRWGMDILVPLYKASGQVKFWIVDVDYFRKWIEAKTLAQITVNKIIEFLKKNFPSRFGVPHFMVTENGNQFTDKKMRALVKEFFVKQHSTFVEHPHTNGQVEFDRQICRLSCCSYPSQWTRN